MESTGWKTLAIIFIILCILETLLLLWIFNLGTEVIENENTCIVNVCGDDIYDSYYYDSYDEICYCYTNHEVTKQEYLG